MTHIAILGYGTVGSGVAEVIEKNKSEIRRGAGDEIRVKYILDLREFPGDPFADRMVNDFAVIEQDPEIAVVVETIGGARVAYEFTRRALSAGKSVVTSNKELVATHGTELMALAREKGVQYFFEASVGGGIPILRPLCRCLAANRMEKICGILNGTTNYILTKMAREGSDLATALAEAQRLGYAEADPTADVEGLDACRKISILAGLAFGKRVDPEDVYTEGITGITPGDIRCAEAMGRSVKLLGVAARESDGRVCAYVAPHLVEKSSPLAGVEDVFNAILCEGNAVGEVMFYGRGAGKLPTASAVVADVMTAVRERDNACPMGWEESEPGYVRPVGEARHGSLLRLTAPTGPWEGALAETLPGAERIDLPDAGKDVFYRIPEMPDAGLAAAEAALAGLAEEIHSIRMF